MDNYEIEKLIWNVIEANLQDKLIYQNEGTAREVAVFWMRGIKISRITKDRACIVEDVGSDHYTRIHNSALLNYVLTLVEKESDKNSKTDKNKTK